VIRPTENKDILQLSKPHKPFGSVQHTVARHWASPRESAEFPTGVKGVVAMFAG
jgi:hypothetical protein